VLRRVVHSIARTWPLLLALIGAASLTGCHEVGDVRVIALDFQGASAFDKSALHKILATRQSGWLPWSPKHYFDRTEFESDLKRITAYYADRGFPDARVTDVAVQFNDNKDAVRLRITIDEGQPVIVDRVNFAGFVDLPETVQGSLKSMPLKAGGRRDRDLVRQTRDQAVRLFHNNGYPQATVDATERPSPTALTHVIVSYLATPGPAMTFGPVTTSGLETLDEGVIRRQLAFKTGQEYDERLISRTQHRLTGIDFLELAAVTPRVDAPEGTSVPVRITVAEGKPRRIRMGIGYGSEEQLRGTVNWEHLNFLGGTRQLSADAKYSSIDRGGHVGLTLPYLKKPGLSLTVSTGWWSTNELTYNSKTYGGRAMLAYHFDRNTKSAPQPVHYQFSTTYINEFQRYGIRPEFLDDQSLRSERIALGFNPDTGRAQGSLAAIEFDLGRMALDNGADSTRGTAGQLHLELASPKLAGTYRYAEVGGDVRGFMPLGRTVLAGRVHISALTASNPLLVPFSKRYFLGGATSLRGWGRFEVSPLDEDGLPVGGRTLAEFSTEVRIPVRGPISTVLFVDAGNVWPDTSGFNLSDLMWDAGVGVRYHTPVGALRVDIGRQLTLMPGLVINGQPESRRWRLHFSIGQSF